MPTSAPATAAAASAILARRHPEFRSIVRAVGPCGIAPDRSGTHFAALARTIAYQQLHGAAAATIWRRVERELGGSPTPDRVLATPEARLRSAGLSGAKTAALIDLATKVDDGTVSFRRIGRLDDAAVVAELTRVRGIGRWSAEMFLMFRLGRLDVWPVGDYGVRKGYALLHGLTAMPEPGSLEALGDAYRGYRSVAAWYCWRAVDQPVG